MTLASSAPPGRALAQAWATWPRRPVSRCGAITQRLPNWPCLDQGAVGGGATGPASAPVLASPRAAPPHVGYIATAQGSRWLMYPVARFGRATVLPATRCPVHGSRFNATCGVASNQLRAALIQRIHDHVACEEPTATR